MGPSWVLNVTTNAHPGRQKSVNMQYVYFLLLRKVIQLVGSIVGSECYYKCPPGIAKEGKHAIRGFFVVEKSNSAVWVHRGL